VKVDGLIKTLKKIYHSLIPDTIIYKNVILPAKYLRYCGTDFHNNNHYFNSAFKEADRLIDLMGLTSGSAILDVGCGVGRLAIGLTIKCSDLKIYYGVDVSTRAIAWCKRNISFNYPNFRFELINMQNELYNKEGVKTTAALAFLYERKFDFIYLYSVFSHLKHGDVCSYLHEFRFLLAPTGKIFFTAFIEDHVANEVENPENYRMKWTLPLHCVRYNRIYFQNLIEQSGFKIERFDYGTETDGQSGLYISLQS
jgi:cyclopropane fatty-acyl-phospholipid synthase-like methyltransferase